jgi:hypothetical protein
MEQERGFKADSRTSRVGLHALLEILVEMVGIQLVD